MIRPCDDVKTEESKIPVANEEGAEPAEQKVRGIRPLLVVACLFAAVGGYTDAYSYIAHGHVFANTQTGNVVFFGVYASGGEWGRAVRHLPPIAAFGLGVAVCILLGVRSQKRSFKATLLCQAFELVILTVLMTAGNLLPDEWVVPIISFAAAIQSTSFHRISSWTFSSATLTGDLGNAISGLVLWIVGRNAEENRDKAIVLGLICLSFLAGALAGGYFTLWDKNHALGPGAARAALGFLFTWKERRRRMRLARDQQFATSAPGEQPSVRY
jgi:uncharacterized membrane protein YoaK (UPF0700 family)